MTLDCFASEPHYAEHLAPIAAAIPGARLLCAGHRTFEAGMKALLGLPGSLNGKLHAQEVPDFNSATPVLVASYRDLILTPNDGRPIGMLEHGAGQTYVDALDSPFYPGGPGHDRCSLILAPGPHSAERWRAAYPGIPTVELRGSPRLDGWVDRWEAVRRRLPHPGSGLLPPETPQDAQRDATRLAEPLPAGRETEGTTHAPARPRVAVSFHWHCSVAPETQATWPYWQQAVERLARRFEVVGHAHPRLWATARVWYQRAGIEAVASFGEVLERCAGGLYLCDNSSTMYEWAGLGWPVVCLDEPRLYRRDVEHGLRFWEHPPGFGCSDPTDLDGAVDWALTPDGAACARSYAESAVEEAYGGFFDGRATERAVAAIEEHLL